MRDIALSSAFLTAQHLFLLEPGQKQDGQCRNLEDIEKDYLRGQLLQLILEEDNQASAVNAVRAVESWTFTGSVKYMSPKVAALYRLLSRWLWSLPKLPE